MKTIDLCWWGDIASMPDWELGLSRSFDPVDLKMISHLQFWINESQADYILFWFAGFPLPEKELLDNWVAEELDLVHSGLKLGVGAFWPDLFMVKQDWSMINLSEHISGSSWRANWRALFVRRDLWLKMGGLDPAFITLDGAALDFGFRCMRAGALVEYRPEMLINPVKIEPTESIISDFYLFLLRVYGLKWGYYVKARRLMRFWRASFEVENWRLALQRATQSPFTKNEPVWYEPELPEQEISANRQVTAIIPTLGRYSFIQGALDSLRKQTILPFEVIVIDQNPPAQRNPEVYKGYEDLNLRVIWQDEQGQSLARNSGILVAKSPYIFLFDDDSEAVPDLIENHLRMVLGKRFHISTGISLSPSPLKNEFPEDFWQPRLAQTFDTGNSLLPREILFQIGGLDRNYDFGPGTDADLGTRLYLAGYRIVHNPKAIRIHYKAPLGGLRTHGVHKYNTDLGFFEPFPPVTRSYYGLRYLAPNELRELVLINFFTSKFPFSMRRTKGSSLKKFIASLIFVLGAIFLPIKVLRSVKKAKKLLDNGIRLESFTHS